MTTTKPKAAAAARIGAALAARKRRELLGLLRPCFARVEPWLQAGKYVAAVASDVPKRNGWTIAQRAGTGRRPAVALTYLRRARPGHPAQMIVAAERPCRNSPCR